MSAPKAPLFKTQTKLPGGVPTLVKVWEDLRTLNTDGYLPGATVLSWIQGASFTKITKAIVCSPFTANAICGAFDPNYSADAGKTKDAPLKPMFNGGSDPLPFGGFYHLHNGDYPVPSIVNYGLGTAIDAKKLRRGDYVALDWYFPPPPPGGKQRYGGHSVFCWDVHLNANGDVDCFQMIGANGSIAPPGGYGISIYGCTGKTWFTGVYAGKNGPNSGSLGKANDAPIFVDVPQIISSGIWLALPGVSEADLDPAFLKTKPKIAYAKVARPPYGVSIAEIHCARFFSDSPPPDPYCQTDGTPGAAASAAGGSSDSGAGSGADSGGSGANAGGGSGADSGGSGADSGGGSGADSGGGSGAGSDSGPPGHADLPATNVKADDVVADPQAKQKVAPASVTQDPTKPLPSQVDVEAALQELYAANWISTDPGSSGSLNDAASQAAIRDFQGKFGLQVDGIAGPKTKKMLALQMPAVSAQLTVQAILITLQAAGIIQSDPGPVDPTNNDAMQAAVKEIQGLIGANVTGIPDADTQVRLKDKVASLQPTTGQHGLSPAVTAVYWLGNGVAPGGTATLRVASTDVKLGQELQVVLQDSQSGSALDAGVKLTIAGPTSEVAIPIPASFGIGCALLPRVAATLDGGQALGMAGTVPLYVRAGAGAGIPQTTTASWRPHIGEPSLPDDVVAAVQANRALYPAKTLPLYKNKPVVPLYDYVPGADHRTWAKQYFQAKLDAAPASGKMIGRAYLEMLDREGLPAAFQTYDNQIITWGTGLGGEGDGVHAFDALNKDAAMKKLLDDLGFNYGSGDYNVVDTVNKKVVTSSQTGKSDGDDTRHKVALEAVRAQTDLMSALIGMSEADATRVAVAESQYAVFLTNSTKWPGQDKIASVALFFMVTHMFQWMPALAKYGFNVEKEFDKLGVSAPSMDTDKLIAPRIANGFLAYGKNLWTGSKAKTQKPNTYADVKNRTKTHLWAQMQKDGAQEGFDPGELTYNPSL